MFTYIIVRDGFIIASASCKFGGRMVSVEAARGWDTDSDMIKALVRDAVAQEGTTMVVAEPRLSSSAKVSLFNATLIATAEGGLSVWKQR